MPLYTFKAMDEEEGCEKCENGYSESLSPGEKHYFCPVCGARVERVYETFSISISDGTPASDRLDELGLTVLKRKPDGTFNVKGRPLEENESLIRRQGSPDGDDDCCGDSGSCGSDGDSCDHGNCGHCDHH